MKEGGVFYRKVSTTLNAPESKEKDAISKKGHASDGKTLGGNSPKKRRGIKSVQTFSLKGGGCRSSMVRRC